MASWEVLNTHTNAHARAHAHAHAHVGMTGLGQEGGGLDLATSGVCVCILQLFPLAGDRYPEAFGIGGTPGAPGFRAGWVPRFGGALSGRGWSFAESFGGCRFMRVGQGRGRVHFHDAAWVIPFRSPPLPSMEPALL